MGVVRRRRDNAPSASTAALCSLLRHILQHHHSGGKPAGTREQQTAGDTEPRCMLGVGPGAGLLAGHLVGLPARLLAGPPAGIPDPAVLLMLNVQFTL